MFVASTLSPTLQQAEQQFLALQAAQLSAACFLPPTTPMHYCTCTDKVSVLSLTPHDKHYQSDRTENEINQRRKLIQYSHVSRKKPAKPADDSDTLCLPLYASLLNPSVNVTLTKKMEDCSEVGLHSLNCAFITDKRSSSSSLS